MLGRSRARGKNLIRSHRKERKSIPECFSGQISSSQSSKSRRCLRFYQLLHVPWHLPRLGKPICWSLCLPRQSTGEANLLPLSGGENPGFQACFEPFLVTGQPQSFTMFSTEEVLWIYSCTSVNIFVYSVLKLMEAPNHAHTRATNSP